MRRGIIAGCVMLATNASYAQKPNILLVLSDDHTRDHVGCYGNTDIKTPNLDKFAKQGLMATRAYVTSPQSAPSRASIMTGRSAVAVNMTRFYIPLARRFKTFPEYLRQEGYFVGVAGRSYHLDGDPNRDNTGNPIEAYYEVNGYRTFHERVDICQHVSVSHENSEAIFAQYEYFMQNRDKSKPFFLQLSYSDPHRPHTAPKVHDPAKLTLPIDYPDTKLVRKDLAEYYDEIHRFDRDFGNVLAYLEKEGLAENTLVVFMGDNGAAIFRGKCTLNEFGINVPLIMRWSGKIEAGRETDILISGEDLAPTLLAAAGIDAPEEMTGLDIMKNINQGVSHKYVFAERGAHGKGLPTNTDFFDLSRCIVGQRYKLIYNSTPTIPYGTGGGIQSAMYNELRELYNKGVYTQEFRRIFFPEGRAIFELYDLKEDPRELKNLADDANHKRIRDELILQLSYRMIDDGDYLQLPYVFKRKESH